MDGETGGLIFFWFILLPILYFMFRDNSVTEEEIRKIYDDKDLEKIYFAMQDRGVKNFSNGNKSITINVKLPCPWCKGRGAMSIPLGGKHGSAMAKCPRCHRNGTVIKNVTIFQNGKIEIPMGKGESIDFDPRKW